MSQYLHPNRRSSCSVDQQGVGRRSPSPSRSFGPRNASVPNSFQSLPTPQQGNTQRPQPTVNDFDDVVVQIGPPKYQKHLLHFAISPISALQPILAFNTVFMLFTPEHWCGHERTMWDDSEEHKLVNIPRLNGTDGIWTYSTCTIYGANRTEMVTCTEWEYDKTFYEKTMTSENNWVCDKRDIPTYAFLAGTVGNAIGTLGLGLLADIWGRKPTLFLSIFTSVLFRLLSLFSGKNQYVLYITQFIVGLTYSTIFALPSLIAAELCDKDGRAEVYATTWTIGLVGLAILPTISWLCGHWLYIGLVTAGMGALCLLFFPVIPESPRWLLQKGRVSEAASILKKVQDYNSGNQQSGGSKAKAARRVGHAPVSRRVSSTSACSSASSFGTERLRQLLMQLLSQNQAQNVDEQSSESDSSPTGFNAVKAKLSLLFGHKNLAKNTFLLCICWSMNMLSYYAMTFNAMHMTGSHFKNFFLLAIIEVPSGFIGGYLADTLGRRWTQALAFLICGLGCFATSIVVHEREMEILMATFAKLAITVSFIVTYLQATELFPTELRSTGSGVASTVGNFIGISAPVIANLSTYSAVYPWVAMGVLSTIGVIAASFLPETLNLGLPETIEEANNIGKNQKFWSVTPPESKAEQRRSQNEG